MRARTSNGENRSSSVSKNMATSALCDLSGGAATDATTIEDMPDDVLLIIFKLIKPRMLYHGDVSCVCKRWYSLMNSVTMVNFLSNQRWPSYASHELEPRLLTTTYNGRQSKILMTTADNGEVYILFQATFHHWHVMRGATVVWKLDKDFIDPDALHRCPTFAVIDTTMYYACRAGVAVICDGKPNDIITYNLNVRKIIGDNGKVYIFTRQDDHTPYQLSSDDGISVIDGQYFRNSPSRLHCKRLLTWLWCVPGSSQTMSGTIYDIAIDGDIIYGVMGDRLVVLDKGIITPIAGPIGNIDMYGGVLYCVGYEAWPCSVYAQFDGVFKEVLVDIFNSFTVVGQTVCIAIKDAIYVYDNQGDPLRISCPHVSKIWGSASALFAIDNNGNVLKYNSDIGSSKSKDA